MKLSTGIIFIAISATRLLLPGVYCTVEYDALRLRQLVDELTERYPLGDNVPSYKDLALQELVPTDDDGNPLPPPGPDDIDLRVQFLCPIKKPAIPDGDERSHSLVRMARTSKLETMRSDVKEAIFACYGRGGRRNVVKGYVRNYFLSNPPYYTQPLQRWGGSSIDESGAQQNAHIYIADRLDTKEGLDMLFKMYPILGERRELTPEEKQKKLQKLLREQQSQGKYS